jgi:hypothetical protein
LHAVVGVTAKVGVIVAVAADVGVTDAALAVTVCAASVNTFTSGVGVAAGKVQANEADKSTMMKKISWGFDFISISLSVSLGRSCTIANPRTEINLPKVLK